jgi:hypothetical protein
MRRVISDQTLEEATAELDPVDRLLLRRLHLTEVEATVVCSALKSVRLGPESAKLLWGDVQKALRGEAADVLSETEKEALTDRLQRLNDGEAVALLRAVEWYWKRPSLPIDARLRLMGVVE